VPIPFLQWLHLRGDPVRDVRLARSRSARRCLKITSDAAKANENVCDYGVDFDGELNGALSLSRFDSNSSAFSVCRVSLYWVPGDDGTSGVFRCRVSVHRALTGYDAKLLGEDHREGEEHRHALEQFQWK